MNEEAGGFGNDHDDDDSYDGGSDERCAVGMLEEEIVTRRGCLRHQ